MDTGNTAPQYDYIELTHKIIICLRARPKQFREYMASAIKSNDAIAVVPYVKRLCFEINLNASVVSDIIVSSKEAHLHFSQKICQELHAELRKLS